MRPPPLICPVCSAPLADAGGAFACPQRHTFNRSRDGYIDLLPPGHGRALEGDSPGMVRARRSFLDRSLYGELRDAVAAAIAGALAGVAEPLVLEVGCGDGYYLAGVGAALGGRATLLGLDVSRAALRLAARRQRNATFFVNDVAHRTCVGDASLDALLDIFAPRNTAEFARVMRAGGLLVVVLPGEQHLHQLREALPLLGMSRAKRERTLAQLTPAFALEGEAVIEYDVVLEDDALDDLLRMTPSAHHLDDAAYAQAAALAPLTTTVHFQLLRLRRHG